MDSRCKGGTGSYSQLRRLVCCFADLQGKPGKKRGSRFQVTSLLTLRISVAPSVSGEAETSWAYSKWSMVPHGCRGSSRTGRGALAFSVRHHVRCEPADGGIRGVEVRGAARKPPCFDKVATMGMGIEEYAMAPPGVGEEGITARPSAPSSWAASTARSRPTHARASGPQSSTGALQLRRSGEGADQGKAHARG